MGLRELAIITGALLLSSCGNQIVSVAPTLIPGTSIGIFNGRILACSRYYGSENSTRLAQRNNYLMALEEVRHKKRINKIKDYYPVSGQLCTVYEID